MENAIKLSAPKPRLDMAWRLAPSFAGVGSAAERTELRVDARTTAAGGAGRHDEAPASR